MSRTSRRRASECSRSKKWRKVPHRTREGAEIHARALEKRDRRPFLYYGVYECAFCGWFHVGRSSLSPQFAER